MLRGAGRRPIDGCFDVGVPLLKLGRLSVNGHAELLLHVLAGKLVNELALGVFLLLVDGQATNGQLLLQDQVFPAPAAGVVGGGQKNERDGQRDIHADQGFAERAHEKCSRTNCPACLIVADPLIAAKRNLRPAPNYPKNPTGQAQFMQNVKDTGRTRGAEKGRRERK